jgi:CBS domain-containing protein
MRVSDAMMSTPYRCHAKANLGAATELMWIGNCGFLPVLNEQAKVVGVITDRDICMALGTRGVLSGEVTVGEAMSRSVYFCAPEDDVHVALRTMREEHVRRLPVITKEGRSWGSFLWTRYCYEQNRLSWGRLRSSRAMKSLKLSRRLTLVNCRKPSRPRVLRPESECEGVRR